MKLNILQENLNKGISLASRFTSTRSQLPILGNILLRTDKARLNIMSTNLEVSVSIRVGAKIDEEGEISIPSKVILDLVSNLPKESIELESSGEQLKISTGTFSSKILGMNTSDFPKIPSSVNKDKSILLSKKEIIEALPQLAFATSTDETRPILTGIVFIVDEDSLTLAATDGFRLSKKVIPFKSDSKRKVVVPKSVLNELTRLIEGDDTFYLELVEGEKQIVFGVDDVVLTSRILEGEYPDFEKIIPKESVVKVFVDKEEFVRAVKLSSVFARDSANIVKLEILKDSVKFSAESSASGSQDTKIDSKTEGALPSDFKISFNFRFLEEFAHSVKGEEICMSFTTTVAAGVFTDTSDKNYLHLIMPVKVQS
jgi:DNA polymerase-3 subunit beta